MPCPKIEENNYVPNAGNLARRVRWKQMGLWVSYCSDWILALLFSRPLILCKALSLSFRSLLWKELANKTYFAWTVLKIKWDKTCQSTQYFLFLLLWQEYYFGPILQGLPIFSIFMEDTKSRLLSSDEHICRFLWVGQYCHVWKTTTYQAACQVF